MPTENEITGTIAANRQALAGMPEPEARDRVVEYLRSQTVRSAYSALLLELRSQYRVAPATNAAALGKRPTDPVVTIDGKPITAAEFESFAQLAISDRRHSRHHTAGNAISQLLMDRLVEKEAASQGIASNVLLQREVSSKLQTFTDEEIESVNAAFRDRLFSKYKARVEMPPLDPVRIEIPVTGNVAEGTVNAPVNIVMFADYQCSACAAASPLLKRIADEFPGKIRLSIKFFPLESIHDQALAAARAAFAAGEQGKFNEYSLLLYRDREMLSEQRFDDLATSIGLNVERFRSDRNSARSLDVVRRDLVFGDSIGIVGTPSVFINGIYQHELNEVSIRSAIVTLLK